MGVAVGHVAAEQDDRLVEKRTVAVGRVLEALRKLGEDSRVIVLDQPEVCDALRRLGFELCGTMAQSCRIGEGIEDMNVWSRALG